MSAPDTSAFSRAALVNGWRWPIEDTPGERVDPFTMGYVWGETTMMRLGRAYPTRLASSQPGGGRIEIPMELEA